MPLISLYPRIDVTKNPENLELEEFLERIRDGFWQDQVLAVHEAEDKREAKANLPYVTISGTFSTRNNEGLLQASGFICIDIDKINPNEVKEILIRDRFVYSVFTSCSGSGVAALFRINPDRHSESFSGISEYLFLNYGLIADRPAREISRPRYVSWDPSIFVNPSAAKFTRYPKKKEPKIPQQSIYVHDDLTYVLQQIEQRQVNICEDYHEWLRIGFALADKFGEAGREYYHTISSISAKYSSESVDKQYDNCLKADGSTKTSISTLFFYAKQAGLSIIHPKTAGIQTKVREAAASGSPVPTFNTPEDQALALAIYENEPQGDTIVHKVEAYLRQNFSLRRNLITRNLERDGSPINQVELNGIYLSARKIYTKCNYELIERVINSPATAAYNPIHDFLEAQNPASGNIDKLFASIDSHDSAYTGYFGRKWLVSVVASVYGQHSRMMLILCGGQMTGKTEFFRRLLPEPLQPYYAESKLDAGKDDEILMCQKMIIMDDELGGKSKKDERRLKELISKQTFSLREPYGRANVDLSRIAALCGTANETQLLTDTTGNSRLIPILVFRINHKAYNSVDKSKLWAEAYQLYRDGFEYRLNSEDNKRLNAGSEQFDSYSLEYELLRKYYHIPVPGEASSRMTATDIKVFIEARTGQRLILDRIGKELARIGYSQIRSNGGRHWIVAQNPIELGLQ